MAKSCQVSYWFSRVSSTQHRKLRKTLKNCHVRSTYVYHAVQLRELRKNIPKTFVIRALWNSDAVFTRLSQMSFHVMAAKEFIDDDTELTNQSMHFVM